MIELILISVYGSNLNIFKDLSFKLNLNEAREIARKCKTFIDPELAFFVIATK
jgi:hypothetical protein